MKIFSELLTEYMQRTGISDSELARTLGVRRQTIFRWKEGSVERPRHREDVLLCAQKLRLSPEERDELLLAAGFSPEATVAPPAVIPEPSPQTQSPIAEPVPQTAASLLKSRRAFAIFAVFVSAIFALLGLVILRDNSPAYPMAASGETLVLISSFVSPSQAGTTTPNPRAPQPSDINTRLQTALEREIMAARLDRVRVAMLPLPVRDARAAEESRQRSNAKILLWGKFENNMLAANLASAFASSRVDELSLEALVLAPTEMELKLSQDEVQAVAAIALAQIYIDRGEYDLARAAMTQGLSNPPRDAGAHAALAAYAGYVNQIAKPADANQAVFSYSQAIGLAPNVLALYVNRGVMYLQQGSIKWQGDLNHAIALKSDDVFANRALCWAHALDKEPDKAMPYCDAAVQRDVAARSREARAIAYSELGKWNEATGDLQMFLSWLAAQPASLRMRYGSSRADWLESIKQGKSPFDDAMLEKLRRE